MRTLSPPASAAYAFGVTAPCVLLPGGEGRTYRAGDVVLRRVPVIDLDEVDWIADLYEGIESNGVFRVPRPIRTREGVWSTGGGWTGWTFVEGREATADDLPGVVRAIEAFHAAIAGAARPAYLATRASPYDGADAGAWGELPADIAAALRPTLERLADLRRPVDGLRDQMIHGDANGANILVAPGPPPAIIDMAPYWRPPEFALAVTAFWMGTYKYDASVFRHFERVAHFDQLLLRVCIRSLLVMNAFGYTDKLHEYDRAIRICAERAGG